MICTEKKYAQMHMEFIHGMCTQKSWNLCMERSMQKYIWNLYMKCMHKKVGICAENEYAQEN